MKKRGKKDTAAEGLLSAVLQSAHAAGTQGQTFGMARVLVYHDGDAVDRAAGLEMLLQLGRSGRVVDLSKEKSRDRKRKKEDEEG